MGMLIAAVASASLLGSMHCVGMCGPLAIWASGAADPRGTGQRTNHRQIAVATTLYHVGRLVTYALAGIVAGAVGGLVDIGGEALGVQLFAARVVGSLMVLLGALRLWPLLRLGKPRAVFKPRVPPKPSLVAKGLVQLRPYVLRLPLWSRGLATGLLTAFLPCGWLYLFALVAAGTGSMVVGPIVMIAFWIGTVPALVGLVAGTQAMAQRFRRSMPAIAGMLLIVGGCYTAAGRGFAQLGSLADIRSSSRLAQPSGASSNTANRAEIDLVREMQLLVATPLPCCVEGDAGLEIPKGGAK